MKRVLIVDDAIELGRMLQDTIKTVHPEFLISVVPSAEEALLESSRLVIDLLITDFRLPGMTGTELIRKIRVRQPKVKVILMTGVVQDERMNRQRDEAKPDIFLRKPITGSDFIGAVDSLLDAIEVVADPAPASEQERALREVDSMLPGEPVPSKQKTAPLRKGTGPLSAPSASSSSTAQEGLSGILSRLRGSLGALSVLLLDESGHLVAQAGELPEPSLEAQLASPLMAALSASAKVSHLLGQASNAVQAYRGASLDLVTAPVGHYALVVALRQGRSAVRLALAFEEALEAQAELGAALEAMGVQVTTAVETTIPEALLPEAGAAAEEVGAIPVEILDTPLGQDPALEKFEELFSQKQTGQLNLQDPDDFWEQVSGAERGEVTQPGVLSFDQAQKLGLVPDEDKE